MVNFLQVTAPVIPVPDKLPEHAATEMPVLTIVIIGIYTLIYLGVFVYQQRQIAAQKEVADRMKAFIDLFDLNKVREFVKVSEETAVMKANMELNRVVEKATATVRQELDKNKAFQTELLDFAIRYMYLFEDHDKESFLDEAFPISKPIFMQFIKEYDADIRAAVEEIRNNPDVEMPGTPPSMRAPRRNAPD